MIKKLVLFLIFAFRTVPTCSLWNGYSVFYVSSEQSDEVIDQVFVMYPILSKVTNQEEIIAFIDEAIDEALKTMRKIFEENKELEVI